MRRQAEQRNTDQGLRAFRRFAWRTTTLVGLGAMSAVLAGCGADTTTPDTAAPGGGGGGGTSSRSTTSNGRSTAVPAPKQWVIKAADLPQGWRNSSPPAGTFRVTVCGVDIEPALAVRAGASRWSKSGLGPFLEQHVRVYGDDQAREVISALQKALPTCTKTEVPRSEGSSEKVTFSIKPISVTGAGPNSCQGPQLAALNEDTSLVTISVGGNDLGFAKILEACVLNGAEGVPVMARCQETYEPEMAGRLADLKTNLIVGYRTMKDKAPNARVVVMGYPHLFVESPSSEIGNLLFEQDQVWMNEKADQLNAMLKASAEEAGVEFVDPTDAFRGQEVGSEDPWINDLSFGGPGVMIVDPGSFHPNAQGQAVMASLMGDQIEKPK